MVSAAGQHRLEVLSAVGQVEAHLEIIKVFKPFLERECQQEAGQDLDAHLQYPHLLQQLGPVPVQLLLTGFVPPRSARVVLHLGHCLSFLCLRLVPFLLFPYPETRQALRPEQDLISLLIIRPDRWTLILRPG